MYNASEVSGLTLLSFWLNPDSSNAFVLSLSVHLYARKLYKRFCGNCRLTYKLFNSSNVCTYCISKCFGYLMVLTTVQCFADVSVRRQSVQSITRNLYTLYYYGIGISPTLTSSI